MKKYINCTVISVILYALIAILLLVFRFYYHHFLAAEIVIVAFTIAHYIWTHLRFRRHLRTVYPRDYIDVCQNHFGHIPLGIIGQDMDISPFVPDSYGDSRLTKLKRLYKCSLIYAVITVILLLIVN